MWFLSQFLEILKSLLFFFLVILNKICHVGSLRSQLSEVVTENPPRGLMISDRTTFSHLFFLLDALFVTYILFL